MKTHNDENTQAPNADDFLGGNYLRKEDLDGPVSVTITNVWSEAVLNAGRKKLVVSFREFEKPLILNKTNIKRLARIFGTGDTVTWRGPVTLYVEAGVEYAGRVVGGIRIRPAERVAQKVSESRASTMETPPLANGHPRAERFEESEVDFF